MAICESTIRTNVLVCVFGLSLTRCGSACNAVLNSEQSSFEISVFFFFFFVIRHTNWAWALIGLMAKCADKNKLTHFILKYPKSYFIGINEDDDVPRDDVRERRQPNSSRWHFHSFILVHFYLLMLKPPSLRHFVPVRKTYVDVQNEYTSPLTMRNFSVLIISLRESL